MRRRSAIARPPARRLGLPGRPGRGGLLLLPRQRDGHLDGAERPGRRRLGRPAGRGPGAPGDRPPRGDLQQPRPVQRVPPLAGRPRRPRQGLGRAVRGARGRATPGASGAAGPSTPGSEALSRLWSEAARRDRAPTRAELEATRRPGSAGPAWRLDAPSGTAERLSDAPLTLDAIAKGYIVERACAAALAGDPAVRGVVLNVGGDLRVQGEPGEDRRGRRAPARLRDRPSRWPWSR